MLTKNVRSEIRREGMKNLKRRFFLNILVAFIVGVVMNGGYQYATRSQNDINTDINLDISTDINTEVNQAIDDTISEAENIVEQTQNIGSISSLSGKDTSYSNAEIVKVFIMNLFQIDEVPDPDSISTTSANYYGGVASVFVNEITGSQSFVFGILNGINQVVFKGKIASSIVIFIFSIISIFLFIFLKNIIIVGNDRYFLEQRRYHATGAGELLFPYKNGRLKNIALVMFFRYLFQTLWNVTIIGGIIKHYEYKLIPYIMAENPRITRQEAFAISKQLMMGEKWKTFVIDFSLLPWVILKYATFNISGMFFSDAYFECVGAEIYMRLRTEKKDSLPLELRKLLNDDMLAIDHVEETEHPSGYEELDIPQISIKNVRYDYMRSYSLISLIELFFTYSLVGYLWEVFLYLGTTGTFINRGMMHGPWLPIYGCGGLMIILLLKPLRKNPGYLFAGAVIVCGAVEYIGSWALETFLHKRWWDYTGYFLNINGRICFEGLLVFGMAGLAFTYLFSPMLDDLYQKMSRKNRIILCVILVVLFAADLVWSLIAPNTGAGITS